MDSTKDFMNLSLDEIIEKRRTQNLRKGSRNEKIRNRTVIRKKSQLLMEPKESPETCILKSDVFKLIRGDGT